jgi:hypothetical protein
VCSSLSHTTNLHFSRGYIKNCLSKMRADLLEVPPFFFTFDWCLRYTTDRNNPVITADTATRLGGDATSHDGALGHFTTRLYFPLCWEACLIGAPTPQIPKLKIYCPSRLHELQDQYLGAPCRFAYSPVKLDR